MKGTIPLENTDITYRNPIVMSVVKNLMFKLGLTDSVTYRMNDSTTNRTDQNHPEYVDITLSPIGDDLTSISRLDLASVDSYIINDPSTILKVSTVYYTRGYDVSLLVTSTSRTTIDRVITKYVESRYKGKVMPTSGEGMFTIPDFTFELINEFLMAKIKATGETKSIVQYLNEVSGSGLTTYSNQSGNGNSIGQTENQKGITIKFRGDVDTKKEKIRETSSMEYVIDFTMEFRVPKVLTVEYEPSPFNVLLPDKFLPSEAFINTLHDFDYYRDMLVTETTNQTLPTYTDDVYFNDHLPRPIPPELFTWEVIGHVIQSGPLVDLMIHAIDNGTIDGVLFNNVIYSGILDSTIVGVNVGGYINLDGVVVGGVMTGFILPDTELNNMPLPYILGGTLDANGSIVGGYFNGYTKITESKEKKVIRLANYPTFNGLNEGEWETNIKDGGIHIPSYDTVNFDRPPHHYKLMTIMLSVDSNFPRRLLSLNDLGVFQLSPVVIEHIRLNHLSNNIFVSGRFPIYIQVYANDFMVSPDKLSYDTSAHSISLLEDADLTKVYRLVISIATDLDWIQLSANSDTYFELLKLTNIYDNGITKNPNFKYTKHESLNNITEMSITTAYLKNFKYLRSKLWQ